MTMEHGREVVAKVPNPNAGIPHLTTASEVATMNLVSCSELYHLLVLLTRLVLGGQKSS